MKADKPVLSPGRLTDFEERVLLALAPYPMLRSASAVASVIYPLTTAYRYYGTIGRALRRLAERELVAHTSCMDHSDSWKGWYCTERGLVTRFHLAR